MSVFITLGLALVASPSAEEAILAEVIAGRDVLPSLAAVQEAAVAALELPSTAEIEGWATRARLRGLVPRFDTRFGTDSALDVRDALGGTSWVRTGRGLGLDVWARWAFGDLVFADQELRAIRERLDRSAAVRLQRERATKIYFERVAVLFEQRRAPSLEVALEAARLDGLLRAVTGGLLEGRGGDEG